VRSSRALALAAAALSVPAGAQLGRPVPQPVVAPTPDPVAAERIKPFQYLYGSAEAAALSIESWHALVDFARRQVRHRPKTGVVLAPDATLAAPRFVPCGHKPLAAVFDVDETSILNVGLMHSRAAGAGEPRDATVLPVPGAVFGINALRKMGVTVIFNTNRGKADADRTAAALEGAGLGKAVHGETLFLSGDDAMGPRKDGRRWTIAAKYCVIAMAGDQLVDISDLFNATDLTVAERRQAAMRGWPAQMWGNGWFVLPNPVYGSALKGGIDDIFPADPRRTDPKDAH
jgi:putative acid phosphatase of HAD superfamily subfamily IIIB